MKPVSLADISYEQGLQLLALRKQAMAAGHIQRMPSEALANSFPLRNIGQATVEKLAEGGILDRLNSGIKDVSERYHRLDPSVRNTLNMAAAGTGVGAVAGLGSAMRRGDKSYGRSALRGGIAGAGLGGGLGLALNREKLVPMLQDKAKDLSDKVNPPTDKPAPVNVAGTNAATADPQTAYLKKLKETANSNRPEAAALLEGGGSLAAGGLALAKLNKHKTYSPEDMANYIRQHVQTPTVPGKGGKPKGSSSVRTSALGDLFGASNKDAPTIGAGMAENIRKGVTTQEDITGLLETAGHGPTRFGGMKTGPTWVDRNAKDTKKLLENFVGSDKIDDALKASQRGGFLRSGGKVNRPKSLLGLLALAASGSGVADAVANHAMDKVTRSEALERLNSIINATP